MIPLPPEDPSVPALTTLLGPDAFDVLNAAGASDGFAVDTASPSQVRYRPGRSVIVQYRSKITESNGDLAGPMLVAAAGVEVPAGTTTLSDGDDSVVAFWRFPHDPFLPGLAAATSVDRTGELLSTLGAGGTKSTRLRVRAYRASRRAVVEVGGEGASIFLKVLRPSRIEALQARHVELAPHLPIPHSLGWSKDLGIVAMQALGGHTLRHTIEAGARNLPSPQALIDLLDRFPAPTSAAKVITPAYARAKDHRKLLAAVLPSATPVIDELVSIVSTAGSTEPLVAVHGDFHSSQILVEDGRIVGLVDVDTAGVAQRADDMATMIGQLATLALLADQPALLNAYISILLEEFDRQTEPRTLRLRIAAVMLGLATGPFRVQLADWPTDTRRRLEFALKWAHAADSGEIPETP